MKKLYILLFIILISYPAYSQNGDIKTSPVTLHNFPKTISGFGYIERVGKNGEPGLKIKIPSAPDGISPDMAAKIILQGKYVQGRPINISYSENGLSCDILPVKETSLHLWKFGRGSIIIATHYNSVAVPNEAVLDKTGNKFVIVKKGGKFIEQPVSIGLTDNGFTEITSGLEKGNKIVTAGAYEILHQNISEEYKVGD